MNTQTLRRCERMKSNSDFNMLFNNGVRVRGKYLSIQVLKGSGKDRRVAFIAGRRVGNAVQRNRAKRLMREVYRMVKYVCPEQSDLAFIANRRLPDCEIYELRNEIVHLLTRKMDR